MSKSNSDEVEFTEIKQDSFRILDVDKIKSEKIHSIFEEDKLIICPTETLYHSYFPLHFIKNKSFYEKIKNKNIFVNCLGIHNILTLTNLTKIEKKILKSISREFCPGPISFVLKSNGIIPDKLNFKKDKLLLTCSEMREARKIVQFNTEPTLSFITEMFPKIYCSTIEHVTFSHKYDRVFIVKNPQERCYYGFERTIIEIEGNKIILHNKGIITFKLIQNIVNASNLKNIEFIDHSTKKIYNPIHFKKSIFITNFIDFSSIPYNKKIEQSSELFLDKSILIDFNSLAVKHKKLCMGYVDLSKNGDYKEALVNFYNIFYQIRNINCNKILIYNFSFINNRFNNILWEKIRDLSSNKSIAIPLFSI